MATPWISDTYKPLDVYGIQGDPHALPQKFVEWLPKFSNNNVIFSKEHVVILVILLRHMMLGNMRMLSSSCFANP